VIPKFCCSQRRVGDGVTGGPLINLAASTAFARTSASELGQYANTPSPMNLSITAPRGFKIASQSAYHSRSIAATEAVRNSANTRQLPIAALLAEAMRRISEESSVSSLFD
jgi:hypothetical protein